MSVTWNMLPKGLGLNQSLIDMDNGAVEMGGGGGFLNAF